MYLDGWIARSCDEAPRFFGDGSGLTGIAGDALGTHVATMRLDMAGHPINNVSSITVTGADPVTGYSLLLSLLQPPKGSAS